MGVRRLFIMGLATDFVVRDTMLDALGANEGMPANYEHNEPPTTLVNGQVGRVRSSATTAGPMGRLATHEAHGAHTRTSHATRNAHRRPCTRAHRLDTHHASARRTHRYRAGLSARPPPACLCVRWCSSTRRVAASSRRTRRAPR